MLQGCISYTSFLLKKMLSQSEPREEIEMASNKLTTMFLNFDKSEPQRSLNMVLIRKKSAEHPSVCLNCVISLETNIKCDLCRYFLAIQ